MKRSAIVVLMQQACVKGLLVQEIICVRVFANGRHVQKILLRTADQPGLCFLAACLGRR